MGGDTYDMQPTLAWNQGDFFGQEGDSNNKFYNIKYYNTSNFILFFYFLYSYYSILL